MQKIMGAQNNQEYPHNAKGLKKSIVWSSLFYFLNLVYPHDLLFICLTKVFGTIDRRFSLSF